MSESSLFTPFHSEKLTLANRVVMPPMTRTFSPENVATQLTADYYARRAANGVGLIITEGTCVDHKAASGYDNVPYIYGEQPLEGWRNTVDAVHAAGGKIMPQLWHVGAIRKAGQGPDPSVPGYSPSGLIKPGRERGHAMTEQDCLEVIEAFAQAAADAQAVGFDGVEIHGAHGYLIDQFFWEGTNQRTDQYGGDMVGRTRFACDIVRAIRARVGEDFPIVLRYSQWKQQDYSVRLAQTPTELEAFLAPLVEAGVDIFHPSTRRFWEPEFEGSDLNLAGWTRQLTGKPCITVGSIGLNGAFTDSYQDPETVANSDISRIEELQQRLAADEFDLVAIGRALLQDPEWVEKLRERRFDDMQVYTKEALTRLY